MKNQMLTQAAPQIGYATKRTPFGWLIVGATDRGLCWLALSETATEAVNELSAAYPTEKLIRDVLLEKWIEIALSQLNHGTKKESFERFFHSLDLHGTEFQLRVWKALCAIPRGTTRSYGELARKIGRPTAARAVARACATNRIALLIPCHRVVGANGSLSGYRWGVERKRRLLKAEVAIS